MSRKVQLKGHLMENLLSITLEAHNPEQNHHRHYAVTLGRELLNDGPVRSKPRAYFQSILVSTA